MFWLSAFALAGCGSSNDESGEGVTLQLSTWGSAQEISVLEAQIDAFERTHPRIQVEILHIPENYYQKLHILIAGDLTPDVIFTNSISFPIYAAHGVFLDLAPYLQAEGGLERSDFYPAALNAFRWEMSTGETMMGALPRDISNLVVFYNKDMFRKAGVSLPVQNWQWADLIDKAEALTQDANSDGQRDQFGFSFYNKPPLFWLPFVWSAGGDVFSEDLKAFTLDEPKAAAGLQFYADLRNRYHVAPTQVESGSATMSQLFLQEKLAMLVSGRWSVPVFREQAKFDWDVVPLPQGPAGSKVGIDASGYAVAAKTPYPQESYELAAFLVSRQAIEAAAESGLIVPSRPDVAESPVFLAPAQKPKHGRVFLDIIPEGIPTRTPPRWNEISETLILELEPLWRGQATAKELLPTLEPKVAPLLTGGKR